MNIQPIQLLDIPPEIVVEAKKARLIFKDTAQYFGGYIGEELVCFMGLVVHKNGNATIKANFTLPGHRGKGYFTELNKHVLALARSQGVKRILLNCLQDSVGIHMKCGARLWKTTKTIFWLVYTW